LADQLIGPSLKPLYEPISFRPINRFGRSIARPFIEAVVVQWSSLGNIVVWPIN